jgi:type I restriction enzyme, S subunit
MLCKLTEVAPLVADRVTVFEGIREYVATGSLDNFQGITSESITYANRPSRADLAVKNNDLCFARMQSTEKVLLITEDNKNFIYSTGFAVIRPNIKSVFPRFLFHLIKSSSFQAKKDLLCSGATQKAITNEKINSIDISLPPLPEQQRIAEILDKAELVKRKRNLAIERLDELIQSVFLEIFDDPITNKNQFQIKKLHEVGNLDRGVSKHRPRNEPALLNGPYPLIQTGDVANCNGYINQYKSSYSELGLQQSKLWPVGTLCITIAANIAKTGILGIEACFPDSIVGFTAADKATVEYVRIWLSFMQKRLEDSAPESAQKNINLAILRDLSIPVPPIELQKKFLKVVNSIQHHKSIQINSLKKINSINLSIQNQAFSGQL